MIKNYEILTGLKTKRANCRLPKNFQGGAQSSGFDWQRAPSVLNQFENNFERLTYINAS